MTAGSFGAHDERPHAESDAGRCLELVMVAAGASGLLAVLTLAMGGGLLAALLVYTFGASTLVTLLAVAPHVRGVLSTVRHPAAGPRLSRQPS